ncbi:MAG: 30S ribosomal protein S20 [Gammaproteobacteria bacterium]|nr:30S ribosomal protein S20 [Gammaproteobacteria bacterium]|tara:strand:+ start:761 stop:1024 length:264 start_codon:yes stop_codon:yes gene_type:complete
MPSKKSLRKNQRNTSYNRPIVSTAKTLLKSAKLSIENDPDNNVTSTKISEAIKALDKAAQKGVIHKNNAARKKSRLFKLVSNKKLPK